jgi:hypothetical protein
LTVLYSADAGAPPDAGDITISRQPPNGEPLLAFRLANLALAGASLMVKS